MARASGEVRPTVLCDTNVLVRFLTADSPEQSPAAERAIEAATSGRLTVVVTDVVVAEVAFVLTSVYALAERDVADRLIALLSLPGIECSGPDTLLDALRLWGGGRLDFVDAYLAALDRSNDFTSVLSFDRDFDQIDGVVRVEPTRY